MRSESPRPAAPHPGRVWKYGDDINTDVIMPARYLAITEPDRLARHCLEDLDPAFAGSVRPGDVIVAGRNFGCGSSREHAPVGLRAAGVAGVIARSFARIFYRNAINIGLPVLVAPEAAEGINAGDRVEIDLDHACIRNPATGMVYPVAPFPPFVQAILAAGGLIAYGRNRLAGEPR